MEKVDSDHTQEKSMDYEETFVPQKLTLDDLDDPEAQASSLIHRTWTQESAEEDAIARVLSLSSRRSKHDATTPLPKMGGGKPYPPELPKDREAFKVEFDSLKDPIHPHNWPMFKKLYTCMTLGFTTFVVCWGSAAYASAAPYVSAEFEVGSVVAILGVTLYILGFASGPVMWAPLSELYGRKIPIVLSCLGLTVFSFGAATAKDLQTLLLCRFFGGFLGASPLVVTAAAFADLFNNRTRGIALTIYSGTVFVGPIVGPVVSGFISYSYLGWRWTLYLVGIMAALVLVLNVLFYEETYHPVILVSKAKELRRRTGNWGIYAPQETVELDLGELVVNNLTRPLKMLLMEPIILLITIYTAFMYGILYLLLEAYPVVFAEGYKMKGGIEGLPYLGVAIGEMLSGVAGVFLFEPMYLRAMDRNGGKIIPEYRLPGAMVGGVIFPIGALWFTWSGNYPDKVHWIVPTISGIFTGFGLMSIFLSCINYIVDSYLVFAASALAANTFLRSGAGAVFPLFAVQMFHNLGTNWAGTLIGCLAIVLAPVPFVFFFFGKKIRTKSKYAFVLN
uniref:ARAD1D02772p n=1 Tax=Blastobotrys adeninivorans TaxID=409370 RepID=A0A060T8D4_BLAAD